MDLTRRPAGKWIIDFGAIMSEADAALYEAPFTYAREHVWPMRQESKVKGIRETWWRHWRPRPDMWKALDGLMRYIATPTVAKHRLFAWYDARVCPDHQLIVIARDDDTTFGILHSRFHELWSLRLGTSLEDRPRYTPTTTFATFPFPEGLTPDVPAAAYAGRPSRRRHRRRRPPPGRAARPLAQPARMGRVDRRTRPRLPQAPRPNRHRRPRATQAPHPHQPLQPAPPMASQRPRHPRHRVATAYGWPTDISDEDTLRELLELNLARSD